jgi:hypothetical protein
MPNDGAESPETPLDAVMKDIHEETVRHVARRLPNDHRDIYDTLGDGERFEP